MSAVARITHIKNPLTIIAMFAVIAEVSGTVVLPFMQPNVQTIYVWYLMVFPILLCIGFFVLLWFKPVALYAPGDYSDENNFMRGMRPATYEEVREKETEEALNTEPPVAAPDEGTSSQREAPASTSPDEGNSGGESAKTHSAPRPVSEDQERIEEHAIDESIASSLKNSLAEARADGMNALRRWREALGLKRMEQMYGSLTHGVVIGSQVFDAVAQMRQTPVVIEVVDCSGRLATARSRALRALERVREGTAVLSLANNGAPVLGALAIVGPQESAETVAKGLADFVNKHSLYSNIAVHEVSV